MALPTRDELLAQLEPHPAAPGSTSVSDECPICYEEIESSFTTSCNHIFCRACLKHWLSSSTTCPNCRAVLCRASSFGQLALGTLPTRNAVMMDRNLHFMERVAAFRTSRLYPRQQSETLLHQETENEHPLPDVRARYGRHVEYIHDYDDLERSNELRAAQERRARRLEDLFQAAQIQQPIAQMRARPGEEQRRLSEEERRNAEEERRMAQEERRMAQEERRDLVDGRALGEEP